LWGRHNAESPWGKKLGWGRSRGYKILRWGIGVTQKQGERKGIKLTKEALTASLRKKKKKVGGKETVYRLTWRRKGSAKNNKACHQNVHCIWKIKEGCRNSRQRRRPSPKSVDKPTKFGGWNTRGEKGGKK